MAQFDAQGAGSLAQGIGEGLGAIITGIAAAVQAGQSSQGTMTPTPTPTPTTPTPAPAATGVGIAPMLVLGALFAGAVLLTRK